MRRQRACDRLGRAAKRAPTCVALILALAFSSFAGVVPGGARQVDQDYSPASGPARVIAQGVVELPQGDAVWRTVRARALFPDEAPFEERPLGFVLASAGPLLLVDQATGEQVRLGTGEATIVPAGTVQQRSSLGARPVSYLSIELVSVDAPASAADTTVLQPGQPFPAPTGPRDLDLLSATLVTDEVFTIPDSGAKNVLLVTDGATNVGRPGAEPVVLLAGEAASFSGELEVSRASGGQDASFVVAMIGPEVPPPAGVNEASAPPTATAVAQETPAATAVALETPAETTGQGAISIQVYTCPPGMDAETVAAAACAPTVEDFDITISGDSLEAPLTLGDATAGPGSFTWTELPYGDYLIAEAVLPAGSTTYILSARETTGDPNTGYRVTIDAANPDLTVRIYNFAPD